MNLHKGSIEEKICPAAYYYSVDGMHWANQEHLFYSIEHCALQARD
jgi:hypothetical protein